uniref:Reverse transcriptase domain-containing protein n=1 Tax=Periophthalmus magnuspinnatus TaxID=409849 RepID=A0A3B3ZDU7_9GOBI
MTVCKNYNTNKFALPRLRRSSFPETSEYFSRAHHSYSRIDFFLINQGLLSKVHHSPSPHGYTGEFCSSLKGQISPVLEMLNEVLLPLSFCKDPLESSSYRPICLLNVDYKNLAKILATYLANILPTFISQDFIKDPL